MFTEDSSLNIKSSVLAVSLALQAADQFRDVIRESAASLSALEVS